MFLQKATVLAAVLMLTLTVGVQAGFAKDQSATNSGQLRGKGAERAEDVRQNIKNAFDKFVNNFKSKFTHLINAEVTAVSGNTLTVKKDDKTITVNIVDNTKFRRHFWGKSNLSEIHVGDKVNVWGRWTNDTQTAIDAVMIRNLSVMKRQGTFFGDIKELGVKSFKINSTQRGEQTVSVSDSTKLVNRKGETINFADLKVGDRVRVKGLWDKNLKTITELKEVKDYSLPLHPTATPSPTPTAS